MAVKIVSRLVLLVALLAGLNALYEYTFYPRDLSEFGSEHQLIRERQEFSDIYYFGESSNTSSPDGDSIHTSIADLTALFFPSKTLLTVNKNASHGGVYRKWLNSFDRQKKKPEALVITLNLRSFDATWINSELETYLQQHTLFNLSMPPLWSRMALSFGAFDNKSAEQRSQDMLRSWEQTQLVFPFPFRYKTVREWDQGTAQPGYRLADGTWDKAKTELACHYVKTYAFNLNADNPRVRDFDAILEWCAKRSIPLYLNLMAENVQYADSLVGKELVFLMRQNRDWLVKRYSTKGCTVVDNLEVVDGKDFTDQNWTTEHYNCRGRMRIARRVAEAMRKDFNKEYKKAY